jgi:hypothetical protein
MVNLDIYVYFTRAINIFDDNILLCVLMGIIIAQKEIILENLNHVILIMLLGIRDYCLEILLDSDIVYFSIFGPTALYPQCKSHN